MMGMPSMMGYSWRQAGSEQTRMPDLTSASVPAVFSDSSKAGMVARSRAQTGQCGAQAAKWLRRTP